MKIKLPVVLRKIHERENSELVGDIKVLESGKAASDKKVRNLKLKLERHEYLTKLKEKEQAEEIENLKLALEKRDKQIQGLEWCIQERDKELHTVKAFNMELYKKVELSGEMYRQFKDKVDKACEIEFVTRTITHEDIKKFMKVEDIIQLYTLIGIAGK
jgi:uncharacterized protein (DUF3084 family)